MGLNINEKLGIQPELRRHLQQTGGVGIPWATPVNAAAGTYKVTALEYALINNDDTIMVGGNVFVKKATATESNEFEDLEGLETAVDALDDYDATRTDGNTTLTISWSERGSDGNDKPIVIEIVAAETGGFNDGVAASTVKILEADLDEISNGDTVSFDGNTFVKAETATEDDEFANVAGLIDLLDGLDDWGAAADGDNIDVTYKNNTEDKDGIPVDIKYFRVTADGVDGTPGVRGAVCMDDSRLYICIAANTRRDANWRRSPNDWEALE